MTVAMTTEMRRFTAAEVDQMVRAGILDEDEPLELIDGVLETVSPQSEDHAWILEFLCRELNKAYGDDFRVRTQLPLDAAEDSRPEPDIAVLTGPLSRKQRRHPTGADAVLLVEVAVSSLQRDHNKAHVYARAGVPVLWIVDVEGRRLEIHTEPGPEGYGVVTLLGENKEVRLPGTEIALKIADLLP